MPSHRFTFEPGGSPYIMSDEKPPSAQTVTSIARQLGLRATPDRRDRIQAEIAGALDGYTSLVNAADEWGSSIDRSPSVTVDPGSDIDSHNAYISLFEIEGGAGSLAGLDVAIKDNIAVGGVPMTCGSAVFEDAVPDADAAVITRLLEAGATVRGKTNMDELAYAPTGETSAFGPAENPAAPGRVSGGSSSGSAAAVAGESVDAALGTDTGGSVRIPASFCGLVGFKPTWGTVPQTGVAELSYTLDHVGTLARDVRTATRVHAAIADSLDSNASSVVETVDSPPDIASLTLGVPNEFYGEFLSEPAERTVHECIEALAAAGATVQEVSVPLVEDAVEMWNAIVNVEFATFLEGAGTPLLRRQPIDGGWHRDAVAGIAEDDREFGDVVQRKAIEGKYILQELGADPYVAARNCCLELAAQFSATLDSCDVLVTPTMPSEPIETDTWNSHTYSSGGDDAAPPLAVNTRPANLAGIPAITLPAGGSETHPIGIQFLGDRTEDETVLGVGAAFERLRAAD